MSRTVVSLGIMKRQIALLVASAALCGPTLVSCKEGTGLPQVTVVAIPDFAPATPTAPNRYVSLRKGTVSASRIQVEVAVTDVSDPVSAIALKIGYPNSIARFAKCVDGDLFPVAGKCYSSETSVGSGEVFVERGITAPQPAVPVAGTKTIVRLEFIVFGVGSGDIVFKGQNLGGGDASALLDARGDPIRVDWFGGQLKGL